MKERLRIAFCGSTPPLLGGAGAELAAQRLAEGLRSLGHEVIFAERARADESFDLLHAFTSEAQVWYMLRHWTRNHTPLVVSSILVLSPGLAEWTLRLTARLPIPLTGARMRREVLQRADAVVALSRYESRLLSQALGVPRDRVALIPGGADPEGTPIALPEKIPEGPFVLFVGAVSRRKRQAETLRALGGRLPAVVVGPFLGTRTEQDEWERLVDRTGAVWLGRISPATVRRLQRRALAQVLISRAETQSLAVLEALAAGTPVVVSDIPSHRELHEANPGYVYLVSRPRDAVKSLLALAAQGRPEGPPPSIPTWRDVATRHVVLYREVLAASSGRMARHR
jgi:glycosyltransferase involved in cell wall biosynthesis